jgi:DNA-binding GntR family transcriptional regulator
VRELADVTVPAAADSANSFLEMLRQLGVRRASGVPLYIQIAEAFEAALDGLDLNDTPLPAEHDLARTLGVSRPTVRQALGYLEQRSVLYRRRGVGTFRAPHAVARPARLDSLYDDLLDQGAKPVTKVLALTQVPATDDIARDLHVPRGASLVYLERLRTVKGRPLVLHTNYLNLEGQPAPDRDELERGSLYGLLRSRYGIELTLGSQEVTARAATAQEQKHLSLGRQGCVLVAHRISFDAAGRGVEWAINAYPPGSQSFQMRLTAW